MRISSGTLLNVFLAITLLTSLFFVGASIGLGVYDPWLDVTEDGYGGIDDIVMVAEHFGESGVPIDRAALMLELLTARTHNETYSNSLESISGYGALSWQAMPDMTVQLALATEATLVIEFSTVARVTGYNDLYVQAMVDSTPANPPGVTFISSTTATGWTSYSFTFYAPNVGAGIHTIRIQWSLLDEMSSGEVNRRSLIVTSLLP